MTLGLFDLDNTLIDRRAMFARWASGMLERQQIDAPGALEWLIDVDGNGYGDKNRWMPLAAERFDVAEAAIALTARLTGWRRSRSTPRLGSP